MAVTAKGLNYSGNAGSTHNTAATWAFVQAHLAANKGCTKQQLFVAVQAKYNHGCFINYALRSGWLKVA
jgi:hypothetical protein